MESVRNELLQQAIKFRDHLRDELEAVEAFIRAYSKVEERRASPSKDTDLFRKPARQGFRAGRAAQNAAAMDEAEKLILEAGRPLNRTTLLNKLEELGHDIEGGDKGKVLGTNLWRSKRFHNLKGAGYWPISAPIPADFEHLAPRGVDTEEGGVEL